MSPKNRNNRNFIKAFSHPPINRQFDISHPELISYSGRADRYPGRLDRYPEQVPDIDRFIRMHVYKEATQSGKIEGTQTNIEEALQEKSDIALDKRNDWKEVQNYVDAMNSAIALPENGLFLPV